MKNLPIQIKAVIIILCVAFLWGMGKSVYVPSVEIYNSTKTLQLDYIRVCQEQVSNYDGYYLQFMDKQTNASINKETFIAVTDIIMSARKDGQNVSWKWVQENQNIPYEEFTQFYAEISSFISQRYEDNMRIERKKQEIVNKHNMFIVTYPGNIINKFLGIQMLVYKPGYISDVTKNKFK